MDGWRFSWSWMGISITLSPPLQTRQRGVVEREVAEVDFVADDVGAPGHEDAGLEGDAVVGALRVEPAQARVLRAQLVQDARRGVPGAVLREDDFVVEAARIQPLAELVRRRGDDGLLVVDWDDDGQVRCHGIRSGQTTVRSA